VTLKIGEAEFLAAWTQAGGSPQRVADITGLGIRSVYRRRDALAARGVVLETHMTHPNGRVGPWTRQSAVNPNRLECEIDDGVIVVFSDAHYWPGEPSTAHRALVALIPELKPRMIVANGDVLDGARISRHDRLGWQYAPTLKQELDACDERLKEVEEVAAGAELVWTLGNHCQRFDRYLAMNAPEMEGLPGATLQSHFPAWKQAFSLLVNGSGRHPVMIKHRQAGGVHAGYNNTLKSGYSIVTGHIHRLLVTPWDDYRGRRWGVDTGCLAEIGGPQFAYAEDGPPPGCSGFAVLTIRDGQLLPPELVEVIDGRACFRGSYVL
jgi:hypothetical protein